MDSVKAIDMKLILDIVEEALLKGNTRGGAVILVNKFLAGEDGVLGNADDRVNKETRELLNKMILDGTFERVAKAFYKTNIIQRIFTFVRSCFGK